MKPWNSGHGFHEWVFEKIDRCPNAHTHLTAQKHTQAKGLARESGIQIKAVVGEIAWLMLMAQKGREQDDYPTQTLYPNRMICQYLRTALRRAGKLCPIPE